MADARLVLGDRKAIFFVEATYSNETLWLLGPVSRKPRKLFGPVKPLRNLEPCNYKAVLFTYSKDEGKFPSYKKFQAYTLLSSQIQMI